MMKMLCATDLLPKTEPAIERAGLLAREQGANLSLVHVVSPASSERVFEERLATAMARTEARARRPLWRHGAEPAVIVRAGNPARLILDTLRQHGTELLVLGPHRRRGVLDALEGTIAEKIVRARACPVLMAQRAATVSYRNVLLALDLSAESAAAVHVADTLLRQAEARMVVVHAWQPPYDGMLRAVGVEMSQILAYSNDSRQEVLAELRRLLVSQGVESHRYEFDVVDAHAGSAIKRAIDAYEPDLLVMGARASPLRRALLGSVANEVLSSADCDVLIVPRGSVRAAKTTDAMDGIHRVG
jgi:universal stress protein E